MAALWDWKPALRFLPHDDMARRFACLPLRRSTASSLKALTLLSKPLCTTSVLVGKGYAAAGQAGACLHTRAVLQVYQAGKGAR